ncbi:hypothetical protein ACFQU1_20400 [Chelatococcus sp. GCM10030263]|uniref:hypothetical protein n=1 Tax=Chelatococcus sp. GCM10030263 TaxID=3273387 RepID=UPI00361F8FF4
MTKSTGVGRGGCRPGAGRKRKATGTQKREPRQLPAQDATVADVEALARTFTAVAVRALAEIALNGEKEAARVAAANALLDRGHGKPASAVPGGADGKKQKRQEAAKQAAASGGKFAPRSGPRLAVNNS